ncbi:hypothetical protein ACJ72_07028 [Emergomyces africanus]|uniref:Uncharacterized protein n=1 Tax=Emergomyces africanus TaxID=1955775 RepID=A0A1B7NPC1_9EURO|nr:hypothetical protein ACJ72_07028 [Emergomyces africanus]
MTDLVCNELIDCSIYVVAWRPNLYLTTSSKTFFIGHHPDPIFDVLGQLLALAKVDGVFAAEIKNLKDIYYYPIPDDLRGEPLKFRAESLDQPVIRKPVRGPDGFRTSDTEPMGYQTIYDYLVALGVAMCLKCRLTWYVWRRVLISAINNKAPSSIRDQVADHESNAVKYYLNREIEFDLQAAALERPSDEVIDKAARGLLLDADLTAPTELPDDLQDEFDNDPEIMELKDKNLELSELIYNLGFRSILSAKGKTPLYDQKKEVSNELNSLKVTRRKELMELARKRHFRNAPTERLNAYISGTGRQGLPIRQQLPPPPVLLIPERKQVAELVKRQTSNLSEDEILELRFASTDLWIALQGRQETQRRGRRKKQHLQNKPPPCATQETDGRQQGLERLLPCAIAVVIPVKRDTLKELHELQCPFCNANPGVDDGAKSKVWDRPNKLWRHIEDNVHKLELQGYSSGKKPCGLCSSKGVLFVSESIMHFKRHTYDDHGPRLRGIDCRTLPRTLRASAG